MPAWNTCGVCYQWGYPVYFFFLSPYSKNLWINALRCIEIGIFHQSSALKCPIRATSQKGGFIEDQHVFSMDHRSSLLSDLKWQVALNVTLTHDHLTLIEHLNCSPPLSIKIVLFRSVLKLFAAFLNKKLHFNSVCQLFTQCDIETVLLRSVLKLFSSVLYWNCSLQLCNETVYLSSVFELFTPVWH